jgi:uncharacterized protein (DUF111 family)
VEVVGIGAGGRDPDTHANVLRLLVGPGEVELEVGLPVALPVVMETNVDDLDPRLWPNVISALLAAGASDAWLTPIVMKKGRPAHTLSALVGRDRADAVRLEVFRQTSTIGLRETTVAKTALERRTRTVHVDGLEVRVKLALHEGRVLNAQPEYDDVAGVAAGTGRPVKDVLADAIAATRGLLADEPSGELSDQPSDQPSD